MKRPLSWLYSDTSGQEVDDREESESAEVEPRKRRTRDREESESAEVEPRKRRATDLVSWWNTLEVSKGFVESILPWRNRDTSEAMENLIQKLNRLSAREADVRTEINSAEIQPGKRRRNEVEHWLVAVANIKTEVESMVNESQTQSLACIERVTKDVEEIIQRGVFPNGLVLDDLKVRYSLPFQVTELVGEQFQHHCLTILRWLKDPRSFVIGVHGMGGSGKTTLLKHIHNYLLGNSDTAKRVIWVTVSKDCSVDNLQHNIFHALTGDQNFNEADEQKRAAILREIIDDMKTVIFLDDLWKPYSLAEVGIHFRHPNCKIILSTRSRDVCRMMECQNFITEVRPLSSNEAWRLFIDMLQSYESLTDEVKQIADSVAKECGNLPLAIITVAVSMRGVLDVQEWKTGLHELQDPKPPNQSETIDDMFAILKFSYDRLNNEVMKSCFLTCVLYPEDYEIRREELIYYWIVEGLLDAAGSTQHQVNKGHTILNKLEHLCLLESCVDARGEKCVRMHDMIRDMGIRITYDHPRFMTKPGMRLQEMPTEELWTTDLNKVSLAMNKIKELPSKMSPRCPKLSVLMLSNNPLKGIPDFFFVHMRSLAILDLSFTDIKMLPESVTDLENLRALWLTNCKLLTYVPSVAKLTQLRVLVLPNNGRELKPPHGMERLKCLEELTCNWNISDLTYFSELIPIFHRLRSCYVSLDGHMALQVAHIRVDLLIEEVWWRPGFTDSKLASKLRFKKTMLIGGLELGGEETPGVLFPHSMQELLIRECDFNGSSSVNDVFPALDGAIELREFEIGRCKNLEYICRSKESSICDRLNRLENLRLEDLSELRGLMEVDDVETEAVLPLPAIGTTLVFSQLTKLYISRCSKIKVVVQVKGLQQSLPILPNLEFITLKYCEELEEIIERGASYKGSPIFASPKLKECHLFRLPKLGRSYRGLLLSTCLEEIRMHSCPMVERVDVPVLQPGGAGVFTNLKFLQINGCYKMKVLFKVKLIQHEKTMPVPVLPNLETIEVVWCWELEEIIESEADADTCTSPILALPKLREIKLWHLRELGRIYRGLLLCPCLKEVDITIWDCPKLELVELPTPGLLCDASPTTLASIPKPAENPEWWAPLYKDYNEDATFLSSRIHNASLL